MSKLSVLLVDDHPIFRTGLSVVIRSGIVGSVVHEVESVEEALSTPFDDVNLILLDIRLSGISGLDGLVPLKAKWPLVPVLMLSSVDEPSTVQLALDRGATGFVSKAKAAFEIVETIKLILQIDYKCLPFNPMPIKTLTTRQKEILEMLDKGLSSKRIALLLNISNNTVRRHTQDIFEVLAAASRAEAIFSARNLGLLG